MAAKHYCNITTDLTDVFAKIESYNVREEITGFTLVTGQSNTYMRKSTGYVELLLENGVEMTKKSSIADVEATATSFWYDESNDILYLHCTGDADPATKTIERCIDWQEFKTRMRNEAEAELDAMLDKRFPRPLPESKHYHELSDDFDVDIKRATALLTCAKIIRRLKGTSEIADKLYSLVTNVDRTGIVDEHNDGKRFFSWEVSPDEQGGFEIEASSDNTGDGFIEIMGKYEDVIGKFWNTWQYLSPKDRVMVIQIDSAGETGTATFKWSLDNGETWESTGMTTDYEWITLSYGLYVRFWDRGGTFDLNDKWTVTLTQAWTEQSVFPTVRLERA